ncbi:MAG: outer membrane protein assembly factor BamD [Nitritalea sp.]
MMKSVRHITLILFTIGLLASCGQFYKLEKSSDWEVLYDAANMYYEKGEWNKAIILYDKVLPIIRGSEKAELADFNYAYAHYRMKRYIESAGYFQTFYQTYNRSPFAEEALFMNAYSLYLDAPDYNLDQRSSRDAVNAIQLFLSRFPESDSFERATGMIDELQRRFEEKAYQEASLYLRLTEGLFPGEFYRACIIQFQNFAKNYPDSKYNEELAYKLVDVAYNYAERSRFDKKEQRLNDALDFAGNFKRRYPSSPYIGKVENFEKKSQAELVAHAKLKKEYDERMAKIEEERKANEARETVDPSEAPVRAVIPETINNN